jgi:hypothetical protein
MSSLRVTTVACAAALLAASFVSPSSAHAQASGDARLRLGINFGRQGASPDFSTTSVLTVNEEDGELSSSYAGDGGSLFDVGGDVAVWRKLSFGLAVSRTSGSSDVDVSASVPHPFFFDRQRTVDGNKSGLDSRETAVHVQVMWQVPLGNDLELRVFAGPTFFSVRRDIISDVEYSETYPFDTATYTDATVTSASKSTVGFNAGADIAYYFQPAIGVGGLVRVARGTADLPLPGGGSASVKADGVQGAAGLRVRF